MLYLVPFALLIAVAADEIETGVNNQDVKALQALVAKAKTPLEQALVQSRWAQVAM